MPLLIAATHLPDTHTGGAGPGDSVAYTEHSVVTSWSSVNDDAEGVLSLMISWTEILSMMTRDPWRVVRGQARPGPPGIACFPRSLC